MLFTLQFDKTIFALFGGFNMLYW